MSDDPTPEPQPIDPSDEPERVRPSVTGVVVPDDGDDAPEGSQEADSHATGTDQAQENEENELPA